MYLLLEYPHSEDHLERRPRYREEHVGAGTASEA